MLAGIEDKEPNLYQVWIYNPFRKELTYPFLPYLKVDKKANRLFKRTAPLSLHRKHYMLFRGKECLWLTGGNYPEATLGIVHWRNLRDKQRADTKQIFYRKRGAKVLEALGHWTYWLFPTCWKVCKYQYGDTDFSECINIKWNKCNAIPGHGNVQTGENEWPTPAE